MKTNNERTIDPIAEMVDSRAVLSPMAGVTDIPYRLMARKFGCRFAFTEMLDVNGIVYNNRKSFSLMERVPEDSPLGIQIAGEDIEKISYVGKICEESGFDLVDINAGCPARKVVKGGKGAALLKDPKKLAGIVARLKKELTIPVTVKIRSGWDDDNKNFINVVKAVESAGASSVCIHPRTREQMYKGKPYHELTKMVKEAVNIPVFASGNIFDAEAAADVLTMTGCDGVYVARGSLGQPWVFKEIKGLLNGDSTKYEPSFEGLKDVIIEHFNLSLEYYNKELALRRMYKYLSWYLKKYKNLDEIMKLFRRNVVEPKSFKEFIKGLKLDERRHLNFS